MIAFEELCASLESWRIGHGRPATTQAPPTAPAATASSAPVGDVTGEIALPPEHDGAHGAHAGDDRALQRDGSTGRYDVTGLIDSEAPSRPDATGEIDANDLVDA